MHAIFENSDIHHNPLAYLQFGSCCKVLLEPMTIRPRFARVSATFRRRASAKNPTRLS